MKTLKTPDAVKTLKTPDAVKTLKTPDAVKTLETLKTLDAVKTSDAVKMSSRLRRLHLSSCLQSIYAVFVFTSSVVFTSSGGSLVKTSSLSSAVFASSVNFSSPVLRTQWERAQQNWAKRGRWSRDACLLVRQNTSAPLALHGSEDNFCERFVGRKNTEVQCESIG